MAVDKFSFLILYGHWRPFQRFVLGVQKWFYVFFFHFFYRDQICHKTVTQYGYIGVLCVGMNFSIPHTKHLFVIWRLVENLLVRLTKSLSSNQCNNQPQKKFEKKSTDLSAFSTTRQRIVMSNISVWNFISSTEIIVTIFSFFFVLGAGLWHTKMSHHVVRFMAVLCTVQYFSDPTINTPMKLFCHSRTPPLVVVKYENIHAPILTRQESALLKKKWFKKHFFFIGSFRK